MGWASGKSLHPRIAWDEGLQIPDSRFQNEQPRELGIWNREFLIGLRILRVRSNPIVTPSSRLGRAIWYDAHRTRWRDNLGRSQ
jgi:hypothetical protein